MLTTADQGAEQAARAIVELINSRPASPRQEEIVEIIKRLAVAQPRRLGSAPVTDALDEYGPDLTKLAP